MLGVLINATPSALLAEIGEVSSSVFSDISGFVFFIIGIFLALFIADWLVDKFFPRKNNNTNQE